MCKDCECAKLRAENERLKEINISLNESWGNLKIMQNTTENKLRDTENRLISIQKSNTHNLVLLQRCKFRLQEIKEIAETAINGGYATKSSDYSEGMEIIGHYVLQKITKVEEE